MRLKSFGCSFIYGSDLSDDPCGKHDYASPGGSNLSWPSLLAKKRHWKFECFARPGIGNLQILNSVLCHAATAESTDFFVIGWTWIDRFDYVLPHNNQWATIRPASDEKCASYYYKQLHSELRDKFVTLTAIKLAIDTLNQKHIPFFMTYMDDLILDQTWHIDPAMIDLQNFVSPYLHNWENQNFVEWSRSNGFDISSQLHPLEQAHVASARLFDSYFFS